MVRVAAVAVVAVGVFASPAWAQARGTVTIRGYVSQMASLRFYGAVPVGPGVQGANAGTELDYTLDLGDVGAPPGRGEGLRGGEVMLILRANSPYVLTASASGAGFSRGGRELSLSDIGFGVPSAAIRTSGDRARSDGTQVLQRKLDSDPLEARAAGGRPAFSATLGDLERETAILKGDRISYGGAMGSPSNGLIVSTRYAVFPQYFRENPGFAAAVTYTICTP